MNNIRKIREKRQISQEYIAVKLDVTAATVSRWETGEFLPRADKLPQLAKVLGCTVDELLASNNKVE